jgi:hypothetical protein
MARPVVFLSAPFGNSEWLREVARANEFVLANHFQGDGATVSTVVECPDRRRSLKNVRFSQMERPLRAREVCAREFDYVHFMPSPIEHMVSFLGQHRGRSLDDTLGHLQRALNERRTPRLPILLPFLGGEGWKLLDNFFIRFLSMNDTIADKPYGTIGLREYRAAMLAMRAFRVVTSMPNAPRALRDAPFRWHVTSAPPRLPNPTELNASRQAAFLFRLNRWDGLLYFNMRMRSDATRIPTFHVTRTPSARRPAGPIRFV